MMSISDHITYIEATKSQTAIRLGINNTPNEKQLKAMKYVAYKIFEPLRNNFGIRIGISSFFRCKELNKAIGGSPTSDHPNGEAIDIDADIFGRTTNFAIFNYIKNNLDFDQLIWEYGDDYNPDWVHVSSKESGNRNQVIFNKK